MNQFSSWNKGIILVTGETGSGKSTTLAAILNEINQNRPLHMITLEDPIEYVYEPAQAIINQREVGVDVESYDKGLYAALREDPDVILIGEMRDPATIETALMAAETGHLVFSTIHTNSAIDSIDRIVGVFPEDKQPQIRMQLSMTLRAVLSQQLVPRAGGQGRAAACELMMLTPAIRNLIRDGKTPQMQSMENRVTDPPLGREGSLMTTEITVASAMAAAEKTSFFVVFGFDIKNPPLSTQGGSVCCFRFLPPVLSGSSNEGVGLVACLSNALP